MDLSRTTPGCGSTLLCSRSFGYHLRDDLEKDLRDIPKSVSEGDYESSRHIALYQKNNDKIKNK